MHLKAKKKIVCASKGSIALHNISLVIQLCSKHRRHGEKVPGMLDTNGRQGVMPGARACLESEDVV